jgi:two-component system phosphate regulon response regulator PhoB
MANRILVVDDEPAIRAMVGLSLSRGGFEYTAVGSVSEAESLLHESPPDLILLDWMLPGQSGVQWAKTLRGAASTALIPIILLTARGEEEDKLRGFETGVDDYITKPFSPKELIARIKAVLRRASDAGLDERLDFGDLVLDARSRRVFVGETELHLGPTEFDLLELLLRNPERVYSRAQLLDLVWSHNVNVGDRTVDVHVSNIRKALAPFGHRNWIQTVRSAGYRFSTRT